jgi:hypothetical protein
MHYQFEAFDRLWIVPEKFIYDGASIPTLTGLTWVATYSKTDSRVMRAALEHDWFCKIKPEGTASAMAAERFLQVLLEDGCSDVKAKTMYRAVKWFGPKW